MVNKVISEKLIKAWIKLLGKENILIDEEKLISYRVSCLRSPHTNLVCTLLPSSVKSLSACLKLANKYRIPVHPISRGKNYGYGSLGPYQGPSVVMDLRYLNQVIECNKHFGYVLVEPGVTFKQLYHYIAKHAPNYKLSAFGGSSEASLVGNALERGVGKGVQGNREASSEIVEVVLSNGDTVSIKDYLACSDKTALLQHSTTGMNLSPLFFQSNLGIVTKMVIWLEPIPEYMHIITFSVAREKQLKCLLLTLKDLTKKNLLTPVYSFYNDIRLIISSGSRLLDYQQSSFKEIRKNIVLDLKKKYGREIGAWNSSFSVSSSCLEEGELKVRLIKEKFRKLTKFLIVDVITKKEAKKLIKMSLENEHCVKESDFKFLFNLGYTNDYDQQSLYWRMPRSIKKNTTPSEDGCGLLWFVPKLPFYVPEIINFFEILKKIALQYQRKLPITFQFKTAHLVYAIIPITFNQHDKQSVLEAYEYYNTLLDMACNQGYLPYRIPNISMERFFSTDTPGLSLRNKIKYAFDPKGIIAPGHYNKSDDF
ncbi:FAD-binding oxidoreductase [Legionella gresilensis]|uniref:FAD-binding oxidoreductase n=1 Tax=Legionella gresilensis TaxID=91823 RepID=UPI0010410633|nr:FAD-binding oxidoreductase [Legionella gresilensis]